MPSLIIQNILEPEVSYPDSALPLALARTQKILNLSNCLYIKKSCDFFQSYEKKCGQDKNTSIILLFLCTKCCFPEKVYFVHNLWLYVRLRKAIPLEVISEKFVSFNYNCYLCTL